MRHASGGFALGGFALIVIASIETACGSPLAGGFSMPVLRGAARPGSDLP